MRFIDYVLAVLLAGSVGAVLYLMTATQPTPEETSLLSVLLALLSVLSTWLVTHTYARREKDREVDKVQELHQANLRTYALKAAEKVNNLSNELSRLAVYLKEELEDDEYESPQAVLQGREERLASAIHIVTTLKSMNDTALSDWEGVIGDELDEQREAREEQAEQLEELAERLQFLFAPLRDDVANSQVRSEELEREVTAIRRELRSALALSSVPIRTPRRPRHARIDVVSACPVCGSPVAYRQKANPKSIKAVACEKCNAKLISRFSQQEGFELEPRTTSPVEFTCPNCNAVNSVLLDNFPSSTTETACEECDTSLRVSRTYDACRVSVLKPPRAEKLSEDILERVASKLPEQPWPKGIHREIASTLAIPVSLVGAAITQLIRDGRFQPQFDGKVLVPARESTTDTS